MKIKGRFEHTVDFTPELALEIASKMGEAMQPAECVGRMRLSIERDGAIADMICSKAEGSTLYFGDLYT